ncbi:16S rRNA (uracil(1498)-N(3))-methyltransferase [Cerasicoccus frondis]|uniref:16S rRNA (uracil(1498)-N(3))-methyltransferase n=1 Tax=Cerasicoccus frondis TaxID=490090 RepID=UPI0028526AA1|nr:16S rRNA (uracil(1498)-N(3))-methyltransferase [Cerasicoccus frondis]
MAGFRSYYPQGALTAGALVELDAAEGRHLTKALRARVGAAVTLFDGAGHAWQGALASIGREAQVRIEAELPVAKPTVELTLAIALLKGKALDAVIKCAVEIGAVGVVPLFTQHSEVRLDDSRAESKAAHWRTTAIEAAKQCGNLAGFQVRSPIALADWLSEGDGGALRLVASLEDGATPLLGRVKPGVQKVCVLIGPEGDFSREEYALVRSQGFLPVTLGPHVLRAETAACYALSALQAHCLIYENSLT